MLVSQSYTTVLVDNIAQGEEYQERVGQFSLQHHETLLKTVSFVFFLQVAILITMKMTKFPDCDMKCEGEAYVLYLAALSPGLSS